MGRTTKPAERGRESYLVASLRQLEGMAAAYKGMPAVAAKKEALRVRDTLDQLRETSKRVAELLTREEHRQEVLAEIRRLRIAATAAGSYVAAEKLLKSELDMLARDEVAQTEAEKAALQSREEAELERELEELRALRAH